MSTSSDPNSSSIPYRVVLNPTPISFAPPNTEAYVEPENAAGKTDSAKTTKKSKKPKSNDASPAVSTESKKAKKPKTNEESPSISSEFKRPDWLPEEWKIIEHIREGGKTKGSKDKYYIEPGTGKRFRSLVEVRRHLGLDDIPKPNENNSSPKSKSSDLRPSNGNENKKQKADGEMAANGKEKKKIKIQNGEINGGDSGISTEEV